MVIVSAVTASIATAVKAGNGSSERSDGSYNYSSDDERSDDSYSYSNDGW
jgi:hypothetical protein